MSSKIKIFFLIIFALFLVAPVFSYAEIDIKDTDINVVIFPINPKAYTDTTITLSSYATDLNKAMIEWKSGSKIVLSGYGKTKYSFKGSFNASFNNKFCAFTSDILPQFVVIEFLILYFSKLKDFLLVL